MSSNVARSIAFYKRLGFTPTFQDRPNEPRYAGIMRDGIVLMLQWHDNEQWAHSIDLPTYRFRVQNVDDLYAQFVRDGLVKPAGTNLSPFGKPANSPWGTREFHVLDPDGNGLQFYRPL